MVCLKTAVHICFAMLDWFNQIYAFILFIYLLVKIYMKRYDRHNKTHLATNFLNSVLWFILDLYLVHPNLKFHISYWTKVVTNSNLTLLLREKNKNKTKQYKKQSELDSQSVTSFEIDIEYRSLICSCFIILFSSLPVAYTSPQHMLLSKCNFYVCKFCYQYTSVCEIWYLKIDSAGP